MTTEITNLKNESKYTLLINLNHSDIPSFAQKYYLKEISVIKILHYIFSAILFLLLIFSGFKGGNSFLESLNKFSNAVLIFFVLIPFHEYLHGIAYKFFGAKDVRFRFSIKKLYAYAVAHNFIAGNKEFIVVAVTPFVVLNSLLTILMIIFPQHSFLFISILLVHTAGTSGDFAFLNYYWINRSKKILTYDDENKVSYFYEEAENV